MALLKISSLSPPKKPRLRPLHITIFICSKVTNKVGRKIPTFSKREAFLQNDICSLNIVQFAHEKWKRNRFIKWIPISFWKSIFSRKWKYVGDYNDTYKKNHNFRVHNWASSTYYQKHTLICFNERKTSWCGKHLTKQKLWVIIYFQYWSRSFPDAPKSPFWFWLLL